MKTYTKKIEQTLPLLEIVYDNDAESPRKWDNLGYFITVDSKYRSPDGNDNVIYEIVKRTGDYADNQKDHMAKIKAEIANDTGEKVLAIYPVVKYEHSSVSYSLGTQHGFDCSNNGFYIITDKTAKLLGTPKSRFEKVIKQELKEYTQWCNGEVYGFRLYDKDGELVDSCYGFYDIEDIREYLSKEWADENLSDYLKN